MSKAIVKLNGPGELDGVTKIVNVSNTRIEDVTLGDIVKQLLQDNPALMDYSFTILKMV